MSHRQLQILLAGLTVISVAPVASAHASAATNPVLGRPAAPPAANAPRPVTRADFIRNLDGNYKKLDANNDSSVSQAEIQAAQARSERASEAQFVKRRAELFSKFDTNKDGQLSAAEFNAGSPIPQRPKADPARAMARLDANKDQKVSAAEFRARPLANFDKMDLNRDGTLSIDEQRKPRRDGK